MPRLASRAPRSVRRAAALAGAAGLILMSSLMPATALTQPPGATATPRATASVTHSSVTVFGPKMYNPKTGQPFSNPSTVTVSQTTSLVDQMVTVKWTNFTPSDNQGNGHAYAQNFTLYPVMVAECSGDSPGSSPANLTQCYGAANGGIQNLNGQYGPTTESYAITGSAGAASGTGSTAVHIQTYVQNQGLNCSVNHDCSLLILPAQGGFPGKPNANQPADCSNHTSDRGIPTQGAGWAAAPTTFQVPQAQWGGDTCSWANRIVIPLHFAPTPANCGFSNAAFIAEGSPFMQRAMTSWQSAICHGSRGFPAIDLSYQGGISEPQARRDFLCGGTDVALTTEPASGLPCQRPFTYAPVGISAATVAYWFDNANTSLPYPQGYPRGYLELDPRLLAKELTVSYDYSHTACTKQTIGQPPSPSLPDGCDPGVMYDSRDLLSDPEFRKLNPQVNVPSSGAPRAVATVEGDNSDMTWEVTRWIAADQGATQFLAGQTDPYGEHVNTYYLGTQYPTQQYQLADPKGAAPFAFIPVPESKVAWYHVQNWWPGLDWTSPKITNPGEYNPFPAQYPGGRSLVAIVDNADAAAFLFPVFALENHAGKYVLPTAASMTAAVNSMTVGPDGITRDDNLTTSSNPAAYPLTMISYAMVPTGGISHAKAVKIAQWLDFVAGKGQIQGTVPGQLPPGYLPLPASLRKQTLKAAYEVLHQTGNHSSGHHGGGGNGGGGSGSGNGNGKSPGNGSKGPGTGHGGSNPVNGRGKVNASYSNPLSNAFARLVVPLLIALGALLAVGGSSAVVFSKPEARAAVATRWRRLQALIHRQPATPEGK